MRNALALLGLFTASICGASIPRGVNSADLLQEIRKNHSTSFDPLLRRWKQAHGSRAVQPLLEIALQKKLEDGERYVAIMGAARLGGTPVSALLTPLLKDSSWMIRSGTLRALTALGDGKTGAAAIPLLRDPALVVRMEAIEAIERLRPQGAADALVGILGRSENFHANKALWVPQRALAALRELQAREAAPRLLPLLGHSNDPSLLTETVMTLEFLTKRKLAPDQPLNRKVSAWKFSLSRTN